MCLKHPPPLWTDLEMFSSQTKTTGRIRKSDESAMDCTVETTNLDIEGESLKVLVIRKADAPLHLSPADSGQTDPI